MGAGTIAGTEFCTFAPISRATASAIVTRNSLT